MAISKKKPNIAAILTSAIGALALFFLITNWDNIFDDDKMVGTWTHDLYQIGNDYMKQAREIYRSNGKLHMDYFNGPILPYLVEETIITWNPENTSIIHEPWFGEPYYIDKLDRKVEISFIDDGTLLIGGTKYEIYREDITD
jgi:hypothetical protein